MSDNITDIYEHQAKACECGSVHFVLLRNGMIECSQCRERFGAWSELKPGVYACKECKGMKAIGATPTCDCGCGCKEWVWVKGL